MKLGLFCLALATALVHGSQQQEFSGANPIRKVVNMLQMMQKKIAAEGEKEKALFEKFQCYCKTSGGDLQESISAASTKIPQLASDIKEAESRKAQLGDEIKQAQADRTAAKAAMADAKALREKEAAAFAEYKADADANIGAVTKAIAAIEKGTGGSFLQTTEASVLTKIVESAQNVEEADKQEVVSFLSGSTQAPSDEILGILKQMSDTFIKDLADATAAEDKAIAEYKALMAAKEKEIHALGAQIEAKTVRVGELGVEIVQMKDDMGDTEAALLEDKKFLADLEKNCATKSQEWDEICKTRAQEQLALADTIKILNDDDALELFKKTLPAPSSSFVQIKVTSETVRARALDALKNNKSNKLEFISLALEGKKMGFEKVIKMIDEMVALLKKEQTDDDHKKEYCASQFDSLDDQKKSLERSISDLAGAIEDAEGSIEALTADIKALEAGIKALDKSVAEATEQRRQENADYKDLMASDSAAKQLLGLAKNRLNKFYNPKLYKAPAKRELSREDQIVVAEGGTLTPTNPPGGIAGTGVTVLAEVNAHGAPPPPPETFGAYSKKSGESTGVISMIDLLVADLDKEMTEAEATEKNAQADYETMMKNSAAKRMADSKSLSEKSGAKADTEANLQSMKEKKAATEAELAATLKVIGDLHTECDWLLQYFDARKEARSGEIDSLTNAKAILSGADYSLLERRSLRKRM